MKYKSQHQYLRLAFEKDKMLCKNVGECKQEKVSNVCTKGKNLYARNGGGEGITGRSQQHPVVTQERLTGVNNFWNRVLP